MNVELQSIAALLGLPVAALSQGGKQNSELAGAMELLRLYVAFADEERQRMLAFARTLAAAKASSPEATK